MISDDTSGAYVDPGQEIERLREHCTALEKQLEASQSSRLEEKRTLMTLTAQLDALVRSSSEVRYKLNGDWTELHQLQGGGFIPDNTHSNKDWIDGYIPAEHQELVREEIRRAIAAKDTYHIEHMVNRVDGTVGWALSRAVYPSEQYGEIAAPRNAHHRAGYGCRGSEICLAVAPQEMDLRVLCRS